MRIKAALYNAGHLEYGLVTIPFPIPQEQYTGTIKMLEALDIGGPRARDCMVEEIEGSIPSLKCLEGREVNVDELDYLVKRLDSFTDGELAQFQGMAVKMGLSDMTDLINLTFCCQKATVITDFSDLEQVGKDHYLALNGGCAGMEELDNLDGIETALLLIAGGDGVVTPYGVVYDNGMKLEHLYDGRHFPQYCYEPPLLMLTLQECRDAPKTWLYLPAPDRQIERSILRAGFKDPADLKLSLQGSALPKAITHVLDMGRESMEGLNGLCRILQKLGSDDIKKLEAAVEHMQPESASQVRRLIENLEQFDFVAGVQSAEEYGQYVIQESGRFEYDENLRDYYDYARYGQECMNAEAGRFVNSGYVAYHGILAPGELMREDAAERYQAEHDLQMG